MHVAFQKAFGIIVSWWALRSHVFLGGGLSLDEFVFLYRSVTSLLFVRSEVFDLLLLLTFCTRMREPWSL